MRERMRLRPKLPISPCLPPPFCDCFGRLRQRRDLQVSPWRRQVASVEFAVVGLVWRRRDCGADLLLRTARISPNHDDLVPRLAKLHVERAKRQHFPKKIAVPARSRDADFLAILDD